MTEDRNRKLGTDSVHWNLNDLYASPDDGAIEADIRGCEKESQSLEDRFKGKISRLDATEILALVEALEKVACRLGKVMTYCYLYFATRTQDPAAAALLQKGREAASRIGKKTIFFELEWSKVTEENARGIIDSAVVEPYRHHLEKLQKIAPHLLSTTEETLLLELAPVGRGSWTGLFDKVMGHLQYGERKRTSEEVLADLYHPERETRKEASLALTIGLRSQQHILTHIFNTLLAEKMISDRLRNYPSWVSSMNLANEVDDRIVEALVGAVTSRYDIVQRYYRLKKNLLGLTELFDYDRYAPLPHLPDVTISWNEAKDMVLHAFRSFSPLMGEKAALFFDNHWIDAPVAEGKRGGAFAHPCVPDAHPYILVNFTGNLRDVSTLAHELGHGVHQCLAADLGYFNSHAPLVLAETASVFAELVLFGMQVERLDRLEERRAFTCQKLESIFATLFRQVAMNRFEDAVHKARREQGELAPEVISGQWLATQRAMFEDSVTLTDDYGIWWSYIPHFLNTPGYVYSYAFGELLVLSLYQIFKDKGGDFFIPRYIDLLKAGGGKSPHELVSSFGVDLNAQDFWQGGLRIIDDMLGEIE